MAALSYSLVRPAAAQTDPSTVAPYMFWLMFWNIAPATPADAAAALRAAGDQMLRAIVFHRDHLELSEQFDATTGYEKSVASLS
jgi:hypothetical protein